MVKSSTRKSPVTKTKGKKTKLASTRKTRSNTKRKTETMKSKAESFPYSKLQSGRTCKSRSRKN